jgi:putative phosphoesterase
VLVALLADTHMPRGARRLPDDCLALLGRAGLILHAGDFTATSVLEELRALAPVEAVHGNQDDAALRSALPERHVVEVEGARIGLVHDAGRREGRHERLVAAFPGCHAIAYGHSHVPELARHGDVWILNPGSPTERRRSTHRSLMALEVESGELRPRLVTVG